jgi:hypothetical protein
MLTTKTLTAIVANLVALTAIDMIVWKKGNGVSGRDFVTECAGDTYRQSDSGFLYINDVSVGYKPEILKPLATEITEQVIGRPVLARLDAAMLITTMFVEEMLIQSLVEAAFEDLLHADTCKSGLDALADLFDSQSYKNRLDYAAGQAARRS